MSQFAGYFDSFSFVAHILLYDRLHLQTVNHDHKRRSYKNTRSLNGVSSVDSILLSFWRNDFITHLSLPQLQFLHTGPFGLTYSMYWVSQVRTFCTILLRNESPASFLLSKIANTNHVDIFSHTAGSRLAITFLIFNPLRTFFEFFSQTNTRATHNF